MRHLTLRGDNQDDVLMCVECHGPLENMRDDDYPGGWEYGWRCPRCGYSPSMQDTYIVPVRELRYPERWVAPAVLFRAWQSCGGSDEPEHECTPGNPDCWGSIRESFVRAWFKRMVGVALSPGEEELLDAALEEGGK